MSRDLVTWGGDAMPDGVAISPDPAGSFQLTEQAARTVTDRIRRNAQQVGVDLLFAWQGKADEALGYASFGDYCEAEFGDLRWLRLPRPERAELVAGMVDRDGYTMREVADVLGVAPSTVHADYRRHLEPVPDPEPDEVIDAEIVADETTRPALEVVPAAPVSKRDEAVRLVRERGGLTSLELAELTGWRYGQASGTLSDVKRQRRVRATAEFRDGYAVHVAIDG